MDEIANNVNLKKETSMPTVKDVTVRKPTDGEIATCKSWPIWNCEASTFDWEYNETETCLLINGKVTVTDGKNSVSFGPGDLVVFPAGLACTWQVKEAVTKYYNFS
jgi:uncharacterized protein